MDTGTRYVEVLIADRDEKTRSALKLMINNERDDVNIAEAGNIETVQNLAGFQKFNLLIIDWQFYQSGVRRYLSIQHLAQSNTVIIVLSQNPEDKSLALDSGANTFVYKGDSPDKLQRTLMSYLGVAANGLEKSTSVFTSCSQPILCHHLV